MTQVTSVVEATQSFNRCIEYMSRGDRGDGEFQGAQVPTSDTYSYCGIEGPKQTATSLSKLKVEVIG